MKLMLVLLLLVGGCSGRNMHQVQLEGSNKHPVSVCEECKKMPLFYRNGSWIKGK